MLREIDELALLFDIPEGDDQLALVRRLAKEAEGHAKAVAKLQRSSANRARHLLGLVDRNGNLRHEISRLEEVLRWIHRTEQPLDAIRGVIEKTVPRTLRRRRDDQPPEHRRVSIVKHPRLGYVATIDDLPGCVYPGATQGEALRNVASALELHSLVGRITGHDPAN